MSASIPPVYPNSIESLKGRNDPESVKAAAKEMETLFAYELIKAMRKTAGQSSKNGLGGDVYTSLFDMELARLFAERGIGIKEMLLRGINRENYLQNASEKAQGVVEETTGISESKQEIRDIKDAVKSFLPVDGKVSSKYGIRKHPVHGDIRFHHGIDISASAGSEIYPLKDGKVIFSGRMSGYGNIVIIDHGCGMVSKYAHNEMNLVKEGDEVASDTVIAKVGSTGNVTGPHLHFELVYNGRSIDPLKFNERA